MLRHAIVLAVLAATPALADPSFIAFNVPDAQIIRPSGINAAGDVAGTFMDQDYRSHGFVRLHDGTIQTFDAPGSQTSTTPCRINDGGEIAGHFYDGNTQRGFLRSPDGTIKVFKVPGMDRTYVTGLNGKGAVTGYGYSANPDTVHGFVRKPNGALELFDIPGEWAEPGAINDSGTVAGIYFHETRAIHVFIRDRKGVVTTFDPVPELFGSVRAINNSRVVAGSTLDDGFVIAPDGTITMFDVDKRNITVRHTIVQDMNADGAVTGWFDDAKGHSHGFLRMPDGKITTFRYPAIDEATQPSAINDSDVIAGSFFSDGAWVGFVRMP